MRLVLFAVLTALVGCAPEDGNGDAVSCSISGLSGIANANINGSDWAGSGGSWSEAGSTIQITIESDVGFTLTLRGTKDSQGDSVADRVNDDALPVTIDLSGADGSGGVMDQRNGLAAYATNQPGGSGSLSILELTDGTLSACFAFDAVNDAGFIMEVRDGMVKIDG
ncbi:MAG: hypothetical protein ACPGTU_14065 [Myxococcota bacterium]